jgi:radical SAM protein with 4Fe4S-binding SPASM domain
VLARTPPTDNLPQQGERDERFVPSVSQSLLAFPRREGSQGSLERIVSLPYPLPRPWLIPDESDPPLPHGMPYDLDDVEDVNCIAGKAIVSISSSGDVYPCSPLPIDLGNVRELPFERIWARAGDVTPAERAYAVHACRGCFAAAESLLPCTTWPCRILDDGGDTQFPAAFTRATA